MQRWIAYAALLAAAGASLAPARASVIVYTTPSGFAAATYNPTAIGFDGISVATPPGFANFASPPGLTVGGVTFTTPNAGVDVNVTAANYYPAPDAYAHQYIVNSSNPGANNVLTITFASTQAIALDWNLFTGGGNTLFSLSNGFSDTITGSPGIGNPEFLGFVSTTPFTSLTLEAVDDAWLVEDVTLASVPEPGSIAVLCAGLAGLGAIARRRAAHSM